MAPGARGCGTALLIAVAATSLAACNEQTEVAEPAPRPVRTVTLEKSEAGAPVSLTGRIEALDEAALGFRISGRMIERAANVGDQVKPGQLLGRLDPANEMNALRAAKANLAAAEAKLVQVTQSFRAAADAAWPRLDHARQFRSGGTRR